MVARRLGTPHCEAYGRVDRLTPTRRGTIYCPGLTGTEMSWAQGAPVGPTFEALTSKGHRLITMDDQIQWGNDTHIGRVDAINALGQSRLGFETGKVNLMAASGGAPPALNWAARNIAKVQSIALLIPALSPRDIDANNRTAVIGLPAATYGPHVAYSGALPPTDHDPASNAATFRGIPIAIWAGDADPVCLWSIAQAFASQSGAKLHRLVGSGHAAPVNPDEIVAFFDRHG